MCGYLVKKIKARNGAGGIKRETFLKRGEIFSGTGQLPKCNFSFFMPRILKIILSTEIKYLVKAFIII